MTRFLRNRVILSFGAAWILYWPITALIPVKLFPELINGMLASISFGVAVAYTPGVWRTLRKYPYEMSAGHLLTLGVSVLHWAITFLFAWGWIYRIVGRPEWMIDHPLRGWLIYTLFLGGVLHLMAGDTQDAHAVPSRGWVNVGALTAGGLGLTVVLMLAVGLV